MRVEKLAKLVCHRASDDNEIRAISVQVGRTNAQLELNFRLDGNISRICLLRPAETQDRGELWRHTCFELFLAIEGQKSYHEFNFAPSREWRAYAFRGYRNRDSLLRNPLLSRIIGATVADVRLELEVLIDLGRLSELHSASPLRLGLSAVVEQCDGALLYWALHHPSGRPDFHHPDAFVLRLPVPVAE